MAGRPLTKSAVGGRVRAIARVERVDDLETIEHGSVLHVLRDKMRRTGLDRRSADHGVPDLQSMPSGQRARLRDHVAVSRRYFEGGCKVASRGYGEVQQLRPAPAYDRQNLPQDLRGNDCIDQGRTLDQISRAYPFHRRRLEERI
jgi:hypothetical protein